MLRPSHLSFRFPVRRLIPVALLCLSATLAQAQFGAAPTTQVHDTSALKPPAGARVALVEFEDMECPDCGRANPLLKEAAAKYRIPWVRHDFPLPMHNWSFQAAVNARWFDTRSKALGDFPPATTLPSLLRPIRRASWRLWLRLTTPWASASALSTLPPFGL